MGDVDDLNDTDNTQLNSPRIGIDFGHHQKNKKSIIGELYLGKNRRLHIDSWSRYSRPSQCTNLILEVSDNIPLRSRARHPPTANPPSEMGLSSWLGICTPDCSCYRWMVELSGTWNWLGRVVLVESCLVTMREACGQGEIRLVDRSWKWETTLASTS